MKRRRQKYSYLPKSIPAFKPGKRKRIKVKGRDRFPDRRNEPFRDFIRLQPCAMLGRTRCDRPGQEHRCTWRVEATHVDSRGTGSHDDANLLPLCSELHTEQHHGPKTFDRRWDINSAELAGEYWAAFQLFTPELAA